MRGRTWRATAACALLAAGAAVPVAAQAADPASGADPCVRTSWLAGTTELCEGVLVYRDYVMDDYGAADPSDPTGNTVLLGSLSPTAGDERYADPSRAGTADLVDLSLRLSGDRLVAVFELSALYEPGSTLAALAVDTDDDAATGTAQWDGVDVPIEGFEVAETASAGDVVANTVTLDLPVPDGDTWRLQAVTAKADGTVMNVAFRGTDELSGLSGGGSTWWEGRQAAALADRDISGFTETVDVADLRDRVTRTADHAEAGYHARVFTSAHVLGPDRGGTGEGYTYDGIPGRHGRTGNVCEQEFASMGRYQPYSVYVPEELPAKPGLQLFLHGCNANHSSQSSRPGFQQQFGDALGRVIVEPLGRGPIGFYSDISEKDVLEAATDADAVYGFATDRRFLSGYSMGGYGAMRLAALYPDRWAGMTNWVGFTGDANNNPAGQAPTEYPSGAVGNVIDFVGNLEHVPSENLYAGADYLVQATSSTALALRMREAGIDHRFYLHPAAEHLTFVLLDEWQKEADRSAGRTLVRDPARVRFRTDAALAFPEYGLAHDRAYWTAQIRPAGEGYSDVDLTTGACGGTLPVRTARNDAGPEPVPWVSDELQTTGTTPAPAGLTGSLANVASLAVDAEATCLAGRDVPFALTTDGPATLRLSDGRVLTLDAAGEHSGVLAAAGTRPAGADTGAAGADTGSAGAGTGSVSADTGSVSADTGAAGPVTAARALPSTGADVALPVVALVLLGGAAAMRRRSA